MRGCRPLSDAEVKQVAKSFSGTYAKRNKALFILGVRTGFRISELLSLLVGDVLQHGKILDRITVQRRNMKGKTQGRTIRVHPGAKAALSVWLNQLQKKEPLDPQYPVFASRTRGQMVRRRQSPEFRLGASWKRRLRRMN